MDEDAILTPVILGGETLFVDYLQKVMLLVNG